MMEGVGELFRRAPTRQIPSRYAVLIDAGSSGSRVHIYSWPDPTKVKEQADLDERRSVPEINQHPEWNKKISPGISKYRGKKGKDLWKKHLKGLMEHAESIVPVEEQYRTPVFLLATAGMRLLPSKERGDILNNACELLKSKTNFYLPECMSHVSVIDGETEGLYGWVALNYLLGDGKTFSDPRTHQPTSYGFMDMGGASAQIAFAPNVTEAQRHEDDLFHINIRTLNGHDHKWKVFVSTWLGFGANEARDRYSSLLSADSHEKHINDPCLPKNAELDFKNKNGTKFEFQGTGDFEECLKNMYPLLRKGLPCKDDPCLFNGVHVPAIDFSVNRFVGVSEYWYTANDILKLGGKYDFLQYSARTREYCGKDWNDILEVGRKGGYNNMSKDILRSACFKATWIINILHEGFGVPIDPEDSNLSNLHSKRSLPIHDIDELDVLEFKRSTDELDVIEFMHELGKRDIHDFLDPFQSAVSINGKELSWTLGRALLYASNQIPPVSNSQHQVGYLPAGEDAEFVVGGELDVARPPIEPSYLEPSISFGFKVIFAGGLIFAFLVYMFYNFVGKSQRYFIAGSMKHRFSAAASWIKQKTYRLLNKRTEDQSDAAERLLEEGDTTTPVEESYPMKDYHSGDSMRSPSSFQLRRFESNTSLSTTTSMLNLRNQAPPSRVNSRMGMKPDELTRSVSFTLGNEDPYESDGSVMMSPKRGRSSRNQNK
jgi:Golgi apyrase